MLGYVGNNIYFMMKVKMIGEEVKENQKDEASRREAQQWDPVEVF